MEGSLIAIEKLVEAERDAGIPTKRIVVAGFSQGGAMSVLTGLTSEHHLAGIAGLSGWAPIREKIRKVRR